jgi:N4-gp56 family major capsid protein
MSKEMQVAKALETNSFQTSAASAAYINPEVWVRSIEDFMKAKLVVAPLAKVYNELLGAPGDTLNVQFNAEIAAVALTESTAITPAAFSYTQVVFSPTEFGVAVALTRKERIRSIQDIMAEKTRDMGFALAKLKDTICVTTLVASAGNNVVANNVAVSDIVSSDTMDTDDIANALTALRNDEHDGKYLIIHPKQENSLIKLSDFIDASVYGGREVVMNGEIGKYLGLRVLVTTQIQRNATTSTAYDALLLDDDAFGIANKMNVTFNSDYKVLEREFILAAVEEYDVKVLRANGICKITTYGG